MTIGERIKHYRKNAGLSQEDLAQKLFVSRQTISLWEIDKTMPTIENLILLKDIFGVSIDEILTGNALYNTNDNQKEAEDEHSEHNTSINGNPGSSQGGSLGALLIRVIGIVLVFLISITGLCIVFHYTDRVDEKQEDEASTPPTPDDQFIFMGQVKHLPASLNESFEMTFDAHKNGYYIITTTRASVHHLAVNGTKNEVSPISSEGDTETYKVYLRQGDTCIIYGITLHFNGSSIIVDEENPNSEN